MSNINPYNIDGTFPVAGQDNDSQGFRDNFTNTKNNFIYTKQEVEDIQAKAIFKANLTGTTLDNDMGGAQIKNVALLGSREVANALNWASTVDLNFSLGSYQTLTTSGSTTITFSNWPATGNYAKIILALSVSDVSHTLTVPSAVSDGLTEVAGVNSLTITFDATGTYFLEFSTSNAGTTIAIQDLSRNKTKVHGSIIPSANVAYDLGSASSRFNSVYANTLVVSTTTTSGSSVTYTGNVTAGNIIANTGVYGTIRTATQTNITSLGTLTSLTVSGNVTASNATVTGTTAHTGNASFSGTIVTPLVHTTIINGDTKQAASNISTVIYEPTTDPIATATIQMPAAPANGQRLTIGFGNTVTSLTHLAGAGQILKGALTGTATPATFGTWVYYTAESTWYRIG